MAEFAYNNSRYMARKGSPFYENCGYKPRTN
jgi:hypothetical protein